MQTKSLLKLLFIFTVFLVNACATIPAQQMSDARQSIQAARLVEAQTLAPEKFAEALVLIEDADRFLGEGRYELAGKVARRARFIALQARRMALEARQKTGGSYEATPAPQP